MVERTERMMNSFSVFRYNSARRVSGRLAEPGDLLDRLRQESDRSGQLGWHEQTRGRVEKFNQPSRNRSRTVPKVEHIHRNFRAMVQVHFTSFHGTGNYFGRTGIALNRRSSGAIWTEVIARYSSPVRTCSCRIR